MWAGVEEQQNDGFPLGHFLKQDIIAYRELFSQIPERGTVCEIGSYHGRSICSVADIIKEKHIEVHVVDSFGNLANGSGGPISLPFFLRNISSFQISEYITIHCGLSAEMSTKLKMQFDLIFIDANHDYEAVSKDIKLYKPKVKFGGKLSGHDYPHPPVTQAVKELKLDYIVYEPNIWVIQL